eukprot:maker-scaffold_3-snap-gene-3.2-mRNA-1 protein AED:0.27 eAED:0.27 QI:51/1/1/1/1/1/2/81/364
MNELPWIEKYRPDSLTDVVGHESIVQTINKLIEAKRVPHLLLYGPAGTGKTSTILAIAKQIYCESEKSMVLELNASDARGIDTVRNEIQTFAGTRNLFNMNPSSTAGFKLVLLDEADNMTKDAQAALRRVIEKYSQTTRFCLICNYVSKIIPAIQSRCTKFRFSPLKQEQIKSKLQFVVEKENVSLTNGAKSAILELANGDMRRVLNLLQSAHLAWSATNKGGKAFDGDFVFQVAGKPSEGQIEQLFRTLLAGDLAKCISSLKEMQVHGGVAVEDIVTGISNFVERTTFNARTKCFLLKQLASLEVKLSTCSGNLSSENIHLKAVASMFVLARFIEEEEGKAKGTNHIQVNNKENLMEVEVVNT